MVYFADYGSLVNELDDAEMGQLFKALFYYAKTGGIVTEFTDRFLRSEFNRLTEVIDGLKAHSQHISEVNSNNSNKRHHPDAAIASDGIQSLPTASDRIQSLPTEGNIIKDNIIKDNSNEENAEFELFYEPYPVKKGKKEAQKAFTAARKKVSLETMLTALRQQLDYYRQMKEHGEFVPEFPYPAKWLRGEHWNDEISVPRKIAVTVEDYKPRENVILTFKDMVPDPDHPGEYMKRG